MKKYISLYFIACFALMLTFSSRSFAGKNDEVNPGGLFLTCEYNGDILKKGMGYNSFGLSVRGEALFLKHFGLTASAGYMHYGYARHSSFESLPVSLGAKLFLLGNNKGLFMSYQFGVAFGVESDGDGYLGMALSGELGLGYHFSKYFEIEIVKQNTGLFYSFRYVENYCDLTLYGLKVSYNPYW